MDNHDHPELIVREKKGISAVWLVPIVALLFGAWLVVKAVAERGVFITVQFDSAKGIVIGKTEVRYKGLTVGKVSAIDVAEDLQSVLVEVEMISAAKPVITDKAKFWYVTADVSFAGVKGLDTLLSGSYINMQPDTTGEGEPARFFVALDEEPPLDENIDGLHLTLTTQELGSIAKDSPITYKQIKVGYVSSYNYDETFGQVEINVFIEPEHAHLVKENSRFWNTSGVSIIGSLSSGVEIQTESLASIIAGGVAFDNEQDDGTASVAQNKSVFTLYRNFQDAEMGHTIDLELAWDADIDIGAPIVYQGITLGKVDSFTDIDQESRKIKARAKINPLVIRYLTSETQFYLISPEIDLGGVTNMHRMLTGSQIGVVPSLQGEPTSLFHVFSQKPAYKYDEPGLHLVLESQNIQSLNANDAVYYKQQQVGSVQAVENVGQNKFLVHIHIHAKYQNYVGRDSRFWNASGIRFTGGLQGFELQTQAIQSVLKGGIAFDEGVYNDGSAPSNGDSFTLHENKDIAKQRVAYNMVVPFAKEVKKGMRIIYRGEKAGAIHSVERREGKAYVTAGLLPEYDFLLKQGSQFWLVKPKVSLTGLTDTDALFGGAYIAVNAGKGDVAKQFVVSAMPPAKHTSYEGLQLKLIVNSGSVVNSGSSVSYRGITIGQVDNVTLEQSGEKVEINISIDDEYRHLISSYTRFYNASGVTMSGGIGGFIVNTESVDSMLMGGISLYNPETEESLITANEGDSYTLFASIKHAKSAGALISIKFNEVAGLKENMKVKYKDQEIGFVERLTFDGEDFTGTAMVYLSDTGKTFAVTGSKFWLEQPEIGLVGNKNIGDIITGGFISILPGRGEPQLHFKAEDIAPVVEELPYGLNLKLLADRLGSVRVGNPVLYRQVKVGTVIGVDLADTADKVNVFINIANRYANLVTAESEFWNTSGLAIEAGIFSGVQIDTESMETIMAGGIAFATPEPESTGGSTPVSQGHQFVLAPEFNDKWHQWAPKIELSSGQ